jgi:hypothetical protein
MEAVEFKVLSQDEESKTNEEIKPVEIVEESQSFLWRFRSSNYFICTVVSVACKLHSLLIQLFSHCTKCLEMDSSTQ